MALRRPERYATLLRIRKRVEDQKAQELGVAVRAVERVGDQRRLLEGQQLTILQQAGEIARHPDVKTLKQLIHYERHIAKLLDQKIVEIGDLKVEREQRRSAFQEANQNRRIVDIVIEHAHAAQVKHVLKLEQIQNDEIASIHAARRRMIQQKRIQD